MLELDNSFRSRKSRIVTIEETEEPIDELQKLTIRAG